MYWKKLISDLNSSGLTQVQIAERCQVGQSAISMLATGRTKEPKHSLGEKLRALLADACVAKPTDDPPGRPRDASAVAKFVQARGCAVARDAPSAADRMPAPGAPMEDAPPPAPRPLAPPGPSASPSFGAKRTTIVRRRDGPSNTDPPVRDV